MLKISLMKKMFDFFIKLFIFLPHLTMNLKSKIAFSWSLLCTLCMVALLSNSVFAQKIDTSKLNFKPKPKVVSRVPQIKANITPYRPSVNYGNLGTSSTNTTLANKTGKILSVLKIYPNPVSEQLNISLRLDKETSFSVKITDLLGNDVAVLANERSPAGEQTKTYTIPSKLNTGIYFLRISAGGELIVKRISVL